MNRLKILKSLEPLKSKYIISERYKLKPTVKLPLPDDVLDKLTFKERVKLQFENAIEFAVITVQEYGYAIKAFLLGMLFASTIAFTLVMFQKSIDKKIAEPLQKIYDIVISDFNI